MSDDGTDRIEIERSSYYEDLPDGQTSEHRRGRTIREGYNGAFLDLESDDEQVRRAELIGLPKQTAHRGD